MAIKLAVANSKGGIAKTTTAICLADALQRRGYHVLLVDCDPQGSASAIYQAKIKDASTLGDILYCGTSAKECVQCSTLGDIIASDPVLIDAETSIKADADRYYHIADTFETAEKDYDLILFDCPPGAGVILGNVLSYVDHVIMPLTCDTFGLQGAEDFARLMASYSKRINPNLDLLGIVIVKYKGRQALTRDLEENLLPTIAKDMGTKVFTSKIRESVKCQEAQALRDSLYHYAPTSTTATDYEALADEILEDLKHEK